MFRKNDFSRHFRLYEEADGPKIGAIRTAECAQCVQGGD